jgi:hypothetical protein
LLAATSESISGDSFFMRTGFYAVAAAGFYAVVFAEIFFSKKSREWFP